MNWKLLLEPLSKQPIKGQVRLPPSSVIAILPSPAAPRKGMRRARDVESDEAVRATNDDAFASKLAALRKGYFEDEFLTALSAFLYPGEAPTRPPLINRGTAARVLFKNALVDALLAAAPAEAPRVQVVSLGAGYDSLPFALFSRAVAGKSAVLHCVELDLAPVVSAKAEAVREVPAVRALFDTVEPRFGGIEAIVKDAPGRKSCYSLRPCDLRDVDGLRRVLGETSLRRDCPTIVLAEIVLVYMEPAESDAVIRVVGEYFSGPRAFVNIEHIYPGDAFGVEMVKNIATRGSPLLGIERYPTLQAQKVRFVDAGWRFAEALTMLDAFQKRFSQEERVRLNRIELLDEVEEWNLLMQHYCIVVAVAGYNGDGERTLGEVLRSCFEGRQGPSFSKNGSLT